MAEQAPVWFITAASSGFGHNIALEALSRGHKVIATARDTSKLSKLADAGADILALDVTWPLPEIQKVAKQANELYGQINYLVNAAGYILVGAVEETSYVSSMSSFIRISSSSVSRFSILSYVPSSPSFIDRPLYSSQQNKKNKIERKKETTTKKRTTTPPFYPTELIQYQR